MFQEFVFYLLGININQYNEISYANGAQFTISKEKILQYPKSFYQKIFDLLCHHHDPYEVYFLEVLWGLIFDKDNALHC